MEGLYGRIKGLRSHLLNFSALRCLCDCELPSEQSIRAAWQLRPFNFNFRNISLLAAWQEQPSALAVPNPCQKVKRFREDNERNNRYLR